MRGSGAPKGQGPSDVEGALRNAGDEEQAGACERHRADSEEPTHGNFSFDDPRSDQATGTCGNDDMKITAVKNSAATVAKVRCAG